jgi:hypothetical protein
MPPSPATGEFPRAWGPTPPVESPGQGRELDATARLVATALGAPVGFIAVHDGGIVLAGGDAWAQGWLEGRPSVASEVAGYLSRAPHDGPVDYPDVPIPMGDIRAITWRPIDLGGETVARIGALDIIGREWTPGQRFALDDLARVAAAQLRPAQPAAAQPAPAQPAPAQPAPAAPSVLPESRPIEVGPIEVGPDAHASHEIHVIGQQLADDLSLLEGALVPLLERADVSDDPALRRHAGATRSRLGSLRLRQDHLDEVVARAGVRSLNRLDLGDLVRAAVAEAEFVVPDRHLRVDIPGLVLPVEGNPQLTHTAVADLLQRLLAMADGRLVQVTLRRAAVSHTPTAELVITGTGRADASELTHLAGLLARARGGDVDDARIRVEGEDMTLSMPWLTARSGPRELTISVRWTLVVD